MMVPLRFALHFHITKRIGTFHFGDAHSTYILRVNEEYSIGRGSDDVVSEDPEPVLFQNTTSNVLIGIARQRRPIQAL